MCAIECMLAFACVCVCVCSAMWGEGGGGVICTILYKFEKKLLHPTMAFIVLLILYLGRIYGIVRRHCRIKFLRSDGEEQWSWCIVFETAFIDWD